MQTTYEPAKVEGTVYICELTGEQTREFMREVLGQIDEPLTKVDLEFLANGGNKELFFQPLKTKINFRRTLNGIQIWPVEYSPRTTSVLKMIDTLAKAYFKKQKITSYRTISEISLPCNQQDMQ